ncbi:MAG: hypothetical protein CXZ00_15305 [Acidobacteria bacterium]|nr:MAG: hypothetical protein CXZ00_15305 [Acidobacteriota bacterium]
MEPVKQDVSEVQKSAPIIRPATAKDFPALEQLHRELEQKLGHVMDLPAIDDPAILEWFVVEQEGEILDAFYFEKNIQQVRLGYNPAATAALQTLLPEIYMSCWNKGVRSLFICVPKGVGAAANIASHAELNGFEKQDDLDLFTLSIRKGARL